MDDVSSNVLSSIKNELQKHRMVRQSDILPEALGIFRFLEKIVKSRDMSYSRVLHSIENANSYLESF